MDADCMACLAANDWYEGVGSATTIVTKDGVTHRAWASQGAVHLACEQRWHARAWSDVVTNAGS